MSSRKHSIDDVAQPERHRGRQAGSPHRPDRAKSAACAPCGSRNANKGLNVASAPCGPFDIQNPTSKVERPPSQPTLVTTLISTSRGPPWRRARTRREHVRASPLSRFLIAYIHACLARGRVKICGSGGLIIGSDIRHTADSSRCAPVAMHSNLLTYISEGTY